MTITPFRALRATGRIRPDATPITPTHLVPIGADGICIYCGTLQTDDQAQHRTAEHITRDLVAVRRAKVQLAREFGEDSPGYRDDIDDLLYELDTATGAALAGSEVAR